MYCWICLGVQSFELFGLHFQEIISSPPTKKKTYATIFWGCTGPYFGPTNTNHAKNYKKKHFWGYFLAYPQKCTTAHHSAVQCTVV